MASTANRLPRRPRASGASLTVLLIGLVACDQADPAGAGGRGGGGGGSGATGGLVGAGGNGAVGGGGVAGTAGKGGTTGTAGAAGKGGASGSGGGIGGAAGKGGVSGSGGTGAGGAHVGGCTLTEAYTIIDAGSLGSYQRQTVLSPPDQFRYERQDPVVQGTRPSCMPALPACLTASKVDVSDIEGALANVDVVGAFAATPSPLYGMIGVADGPTFTVQRSTGGAFTIGIECAAVSATCLPTPAGVHALVQVLRDLITQQTADPSCAAAAN